MPIVAWSDEDFITEWTTFCAVYNIFMCWNTDYKNLVEMKIVEMKKEKSKQSRQ